MRSVHKKEPSQSISSTKRLSSRGWISSLVSTVVFLAVLLGLALNSQALIDTFNYYQFKPSQQIAEFATEAGMSDKGKFLFYASQPSLEEAKAFNAQCDREETTTAILGCYDGRNIYIYDVADTRLSGIRETTAAHEMLHAAYARLSESDRERVDRLLESEYESLKSNVDLQERMAFYERTEPGERNNELHSLIGTEVAKVSPELEAYYMRYFTDRSKVVALYNQYDSIFKDLKAKSDELNIEIDRLYASIKEDSATYNAEAASIKQAIGAFSAKARQGGFTSQSEFNYERQRLMARVSSLDTMRERINSDIDRYKQLVSELNSLAIETNELNRSLDSTLAAPPSI